VINDAIFNRNEGSHFSQSVWWPGDSYFMMLKGKSHKFIKKISHLGRIISVEMPPL
jgi:hypothetical protein